MCKQDKREFLYVPMYDVFVCMCVCISRTHLHPPAYGVQVLPTAYTDRYLIDRCALLLEH